jgi:phosphoglycerate kinase
MEGLDPRLRLMQQADLKGKVVLVRVDHNVVKKGRIEDPYRIEATLGTLYAIADKGGRPVLMTHVGRPFDKKTGKIRCKPEESVAPVVAYLKQKLPVEVLIPQFPADPDRGILHVDPSVQTALRSLKDGRASMIYLPNTRWFTGEESKGVEREVLARELAALADVYVNDAFGSWQAHASTYDVARYVPSYAGLLLQREIQGLSRVLEPKRPFTAVIAGAKYDTKIGPLKALHERVDRLILGGVIYNTFLAAKYGLTFAGVSDEDKALAAELVSLDKTAGKVVELPYLVESDTLDGRVEGRYRTLGPAEWREKKTLSYVVDAAAQSFEDSGVKEAILSAGTVFVNAVMGFMPHFFEGSEAMYRLLASNASAQKLLGGGDTLQELRRLCPGIYLAGLDDPSTYYFTGGGAVLSAIEQGGPYGLKPIKALMNEK